MLKNYIVRFTTILLPAVLKLNLQKFLKQGKKRRGGEEFSVISVLYDFWNQKVAYFYFLTTMKTGVLKNNMLNSSFKLHMNSQSRYFNWFIKLSFSTKWRNANSPLLQLY